MNGSPDDARSVAQYVGAVAPLLAMPLEPARFEAVVAVMRRIAHFADDISALDLAHDVEVAGVFIP